MKKLVLFLLYCIALGYIAPAQSLYNFTYKNETYTPLSSGTTILSGKFIDTLSLGFDVTIGGVKNDTLLVMRNGSMAFPSGIPFTFFAADLLNGSQSYKITGSTGSRIVVIEFANTKFGHDMTSADYVNFQVRMYEADNAIEIRFGYSSVNNPDWSYYYQNGGAGIGYPKTSLKGPAASPVADTTSGIYLAGTPPNGMVYRFEPKSVGLSSINNEKSFQLFPNPGTGLISFHIPDAGSYTVQVFDVAQHCVSETMLSKTNNKLDITAYNDGIYIISVIDENGKTQRYTYVKH